MEQYPAGQAVLAWRRQKALVQPGCAASQQSLFWPQGSPRRTPQASVVVGMGPGSPQGSGTIISEIPAASPPSVGVMPAARGAGASGSVLHPTATS